MFSMREGRYKFLIPLISSLYKRDLNSDFFFFFDKLNSDSLFNNKIP